MWCNKHQIDAVPVFHYVRRGNPEDDAQPEFSHYECPECMADAQRESEMQSAVDDWLKPDGRSES